MVLVATVHFVFRPGETWGDWTISMHFLTWSLSVSYVRAFVWSDAKLPGIIRLPFSYHSQKNLERWIQYSYLPVVNWIILLFMTYMWVLCESFMAQNMNVHAYLHAQKNNNNDIFVQHDMDWSIGTWHGLDMDGDMDCCHPCLFCS